MRGLCDVRRITTDGEAAAGGPGISRIKVQMQLDL